MRVTILLLTVCVSLAAALPARAACFDVSKGEPGELSGVLGYRIFAGPPGYEDVQKGDTPEPAYVLTLPAPICLEGDEFADPSDMFDEVQLVETETSAAALAAAKGKTVTVTLTDPMAAHTGHHHRPLVAWVRDVSVKDSAADERDPTEEYGTGAAVVRAFYLALGAGEGGIAARYIVPEKRKGPFAPDALSRFYGSLPDPLTLQDVAPEGANRFRVYYGFTSRAGVCDGAAIVTTTRRDGRFFIQGIKALNGC